MSCIVKDPDNKWETYIDWTDWLADVTDTYGGTVTITNSAWFPETGITQESSEIVGTKTVMIGSGGTAGTSYNLINRITYNPSALTVTNLTEDRTISVTIREK